MASNLDIHLVKNNHRNLFISFRVSLLTNQQTNQRYQKHRLLGGGKKGEGEKRKVIILPGKISKSQTGGGEERGFNLLQQRLL